MNINAPKTHTVSSRMWTALTIVFLTVFTIGMLKNLGNVAFWQDEGETMQYARTILKYGYPSVFDGRSFILLDTGDTQYDPTYYFKYWTPYLQSYIAAIPLLLNHGIADTFLIRLPFALFAIAGVWISWVMFRKLGYSRFVLFLYSLSLSTSVQLYLYWRQARHYALQFPLALGLLYSYLNLGKRKWNVLFILFGFLFYHAYYPGFIGFYIAITIHAIIRKFVGAKHNVKPFLVCTAVLLFIHVPTYFFLHHYAQRPSSDPIAAFGAYIIDLNYFAYLKITVLSSLILAFSLLKAKKPIHFKKLFVEIFRSYHYSFSLFILVIIALPIISSFGFRNPRYVSVVFPLAFLTAGVAWEKVVGARKFLSLPLLSILVLISHPGFLSQIKQFYGELNSTYVGPVTGIVNTISGVTDKRSIDASRTLRPDLLIATNFENAAIYGYMNNQLVSFLSPTDQYKFGTRLPDWVIIRKSWEQKDYLQGFLKKGSYEKIETDYCDLPYENVYLVRTHHFQTVTDCPDEKLTLYRKID